MKKIRLVANTVVCNEECWVWYALKSVLPYIDEILVWDTGSSDATVFIINSIRSQKIKFRSVNPTSNETALSLTRQEMLLKTRANWLMILDGDEVWPEQSLKTILKFIALRGDKFDSIVVPSLNCVGDIYHISPPESGKYKIAGKTGHYNLRFINLDRIKGLHVENPPGHLQSYYDSKNIKVQDRNPENIAFLNAPYLHMTHLTRSRKRKDETSIFWRGAKKRHELGMRLPKNFVYPQVFNIPRPEVIPSPWVKRSLYFCIKSSLLEPLRQLKRFLM